MKAIHVFLCLILWRCINAEESEILCKVDPSSDIQDKTRAALRPGETAEVVCKQSFKTKTKKQRDTVSCTDNGWSFHPFCEEIECHIAQEPNVRWARYFRFRHKDTVTSSYFACQEGYEPSPRSMCDVGGWVPPLCEAINCEPEIPNAVILSEMRKYAISERLEYECHPFHEPRGRQVTHCTVYGWYRNPQCRAMTGFCQRPDFKNGYLINHESNPSVIYYGCLPGLKPSVEGWWGELKCQGETWPQLPKCIGKMKCAAPTISNAKWKEKEEEYSNGDVLKYECDEGYEMESNDRIKCINGSWESPLPICKPSMCNPPPHVEYATIMSAYKTKYIHLSKVQYKCKELYELHGNSEVTCRHGTWSTIPKCISAQLKCEDPPIPENGDIIKQEEKDGGTEVTYQCKLGYKLKNDAKVKCLQGEWRPFPVCLRKKKCVAPTIANAKWKEKEEEYSNGDVLTYECDEGYAMESNDRIKCINGSWESPLPICKQNALSPDDKIKNAVIAYKKEGPYKNGTEVNYRCEDKFHSEGQTKAIYINGDWHYPHCIAKDYCEKPNLTNGFVKFPGEGEFREGAMLDYDCFPPCKRKTGETIICKNGRWDPPAECTCAQLKCEDPPIPENGYIIKQEEKDGGTEVTYQCNLGYKLKNDAKVKCLQGEWRAFPVCLRPCVIGEIDAKYNLQTPREKYLSHGDKMRIYCKGYYWNYEDHVSYIEVVCQDGKVEYKSCQR